MSHQLSLGQVTYESAVFAAEPAAEEGGGGDQETTGAKGRGETTGHHPSCRQTQATGRQERGESAGHLSRVPQTHPTTRSDPPVVPPHASPVSLSPESEKYDLEHVVKLRDIEVKEVLDQVQNCRGKLYDVSLH